MEIRKLTRDDFLRVSVLFKGVREGLRRPGLLREISDSMLEDALLNGVFYGAFKKGELIGVSGLELDDFPYEIRDDFGLGKSEIGEIMFMAVSEENRGHGVATKINDVLIKKAKELGAKAVAMSVHPENLAAIKCVMRLGDVRLVGFDNRSYDEPNVVYGVRL